MEACSSTTASYSYTGGDPSITDIVGAGSITACQPFQGGGGRAKKGRAKKGRSKTKSRRKLSKRLRRISHMKVRSMKMYKKRLKNKTKRTKLHKEIMRSIEANKPLSKESLKNLTPSMKKFLEGISTDSNTVLKFSDFKNKGKGKGKKRSTRTRGGGGGCRDPDI